MAIECGIVSLSDLCDPILHGVHSFLPKQLLNRIIFSVGVDSATLGWSDLGALVAQAGSV